MQPAKCKAVHWSSLAAILVALSATGIAEARARYNAQIVRTTFGVPHIEAPNYQGLGYGIGYTAAEDSLCLLAEQRLSVRGERLKAFGAAKTTVGFQEISNLDSDVYYRTIGDLAALRANFAKASPDYRALISGFVAGYNRYLRDNAGRQSDPCQGASWVQPMNVDDALLLHNAAMLETGLSGLAAQIAAAVPPKRGETQASDAGLPPARDPTRVGSNGWAFGGNATTNGRGMVVGNPHFPWTGPNRFRQLHLTIPGRLNVMGASLVVSPFIAIGFNRDVAWTHTVSTSEHHTFFELALDPTDPTAYFVDGKGEPMSRRTVVIEGKDQPPITHTVYGSRFGYVLAMPKAGLGWTMRRAYAVKDANLFNLRSGDTWLRIGRARDVRGVRRIIGETLGAPYVNTIAADRKGEALYADVTPVPNVSVEKLARCTPEVGRAPALVSRRLFVLDGARSDCDWEQDRLAAVSGLVPEHRLPTLVRRDFVQNSNDSYWLSNPASPLPATLPLVGSVGERISFRTQSGITEIRRRLDGSDGLGGKTVDHERAREMMFGNKSMAAERMLDDVIRICRDEASLLAACSALQKWDRRADLESRGARLFFSFVRHSGSIKDLWHTPFDPADPVNTPRGISPAQGTTTAVREALAKAAGELTALKVSLDAPLGAVQVALRGGERVPIHGGPHAAGILNMMMSRPENGALVPAHGSSYVQIVGFDDDGPVADALLAYSQSTNPSSPHFADQTRAFSKKMWHRLPFSRSAIASEVLGERVRLSE